MPEKWAWQATASNKGIKILQVSAFKDKKF
jgi:hypothetical protein